MKKKAMNGGDLKSARETEMGKERNPANRNQTAWQVHMTMGVIMAVMLLTWAVGLPLYAQTYPVKPIRLIIGMAPGGQSDTVGRIIGPKLAAQLGQPVVIENRPGSGVGVAYGFTAKSDPDGYTIILGSSSLSMASSLYKKLNYDPVKDFAPISLVAQSPYVLVVRSSLPFKTLQELVDYAKANPGKLNYGSAGIGSAPNLATELFKSLGQINIVHVPYKGGGPAMVGLLGGEVDLQVTNPPILLPLIKAGKVRPLVVLQNKRVPELSDVPTAKEAGMDGLEMILWYGLLAPAKTPREVINRLNAAWVKAEATPETKEHMLKSQSIPFSSTPEQFSEFLNAEMVRWAKVIKEANIPKID